MNEFKTIIVKRKGNVSKIKNPTHFKFIGKGAQGAVFLLSEERCVKIYANKNYCKRESKALDLAQESKIVPKVYEVGRNYIVMEYIKGEPLKHYLKEYRSVPKSITKQLLFIFQEMKRIGFTRIDAKIRHVIVNDKGVIKVIDHVNSCKKKILFPMEFFSELKKLKLLDSFLYQVKKIDPSQYSKWKNSLKNMKI